MMTDRQIAYQLGEQEWRCAYPCLGNGVGGSINPGDPIAKAYDNHALVHLHCAQVGVAPDPPLPHEMKPHGTAGNRYADR